MANLFSQLGKDFIRSAVKQVGRDGGKVISNQIYGDGHSTPVRGVAGGGISGDGIEDIKESEKFDLGRILTLEERAVAEQAGYRLEGDLNHWTGCFGAGSFAIILFFMFGFSSVSHSIGYFLCAVVLVRAFYKFRTKSRKLAKPYRKMTFVPDRRTKYGERYAGDITISHKIDVELNAAERKVIVKRTVMYLVIALVMIFAGTIRSTLSPYYHSFVDQYSILNDNQEPQPEEPEVDQESVNL